MVKSTGIVRKVDELGRIVIPIELRRTLDIGVKDSLEIYVEDDQIILKKYMPALYNALGIYLPLITTNCAVLGVCINNIDLGYNYPQALVNSLGAGIGFLLAMVLFSGMRRKTEGSTAVPKPFRGVPITMTTAALLSLAFMGFGGLV